MHPDILKAIMDERDRERRAEAKEATKARRLLRRRAR